MPDLNTTVLPDGEYGRQLYIGMERPAYADFQSIENRPTTMQKPLGGLWTSTWVGRPEMSAWVQWAAKEQFYTGGEEGWVIGPTPGTELVVVDSEDDYDALVDEYPMRSDTGSTKLDFEDIGYDYDGMWLTAEGQRVTRFYPGARNVENLYGWDTESTVWFDWRVGGVEHVGRVKWQDHPNYREL